MKGQTRVYEMHYLNLYIGTGKISQLAALAGKKRRYIDGRIHGIVSDSVNFMFYDVTDKIKYNVYRGSTFIEAITKKEIMEKYVVSAKRFDGLCSKAEKTLALKSIHAENFDKARLWVERAPYEQLIPIQKGEKTYV